MCLGFMIVILMKIEKASKQKNYIMHLSNYLNGGLCEQMGLMELYMIIIKKRHPYILMNQLKSVMLN